MVPIEGSEELDSTLTEAPDSEPVFINNYLNTIQPRYLMLTSLPTTCAICNVEYDESAMAEN